MKRLLLFILLVQFPMIAQEIQFTTADELAYLVKDPFLL